MKDQEIFEIIIISSIGKNRGGIGYNYSNLISNSNFLLEYVKSYKDNKPTRLNEVRLMEAFMNTATEQDKEILKKELEVYGISKQFIEKKDFRNLYIANEIIKRYKFETDLKDKEKGLILKNLLRSDILKRDPSLIRALDVLVTENGLKEQEAYGILINLALGINWKAIGYQYEKILSSKEKLQELINNKNINIQPKVSNLSIAIAKSNSLSEEEEKEFIQELINIGISKELIESREIKNLYMAKYILDNYNFKMKLSNQSKSDIFLAIIKNKRFEIGLFCYLSNIMKTLELTGFSEQEIYGIIINSGLNSTVVEDSGFHYSNLLLNKGNCAKKLIEYKGKIKTDFTKGDLIKARFLNLTQEEINNIISMYDELEIDREFTEQKDPRNLYMALEIVNNFKSRYNHTNQQKRGILKEILKSFPLNKGGMGNLIELYKVLEKIGLTEQQIYGTIINWGCKEYVLPYTGYGYSKILQSGKNKLLELSKYKKDFETKVDPYTFENARINNFTKSEQEEVKKEYYSLGIERSYIDKKDFNSIYIAKQIVDGYHLFGRKISKKEKAALLQAVLSNSLLDSNSKFSNSLHALIKRLKDMGFTYNQRRGIIINAAVNGSIVDRDGLGYRNLLGNENKVLELEKYKDEIKTKVSEVTILKATANYLNNTDIEVLKDKFESYGLPSEFIEKKDPKNLYVAMKILNGYNFKQVISDDMKKFILYSILNYSCLDKGKVCLLTLIEKLDNIGLKEEQVWGLMINTVTTGNILKEGGYSYLQLLTEKNKALELAKYKDELQTEVDIEKIRSVMKKSKEIMRSSVKELKDAGMIHQVPQTLKDLQNMTQKSEAEQNNDFDNVKNSPIDNYIYKFEE